MAISVPVCNTVKGAIRVVTKKVTADSLKKSPAVNTVFKRIADSIHLAFTPNLGKIFPSPVQRGNIMQFTLTVKQTGIYNIQVIASGGNSIMTKQVKTITKELAEKIVIGSNWEKGVYFIIVSDNNNKQVYKNSFMVL